jgi:hypothetical protein
LGVGIENLVSEDKEVVQSAGQEGSSCRRATLTLAECLVLDMGMRDAVPRHRWVWLNGHNAVRGWLADGLQLEANLERAQVDAFKAYGLCHHTNLAGFRISLDLSEFLFQRHDFAEDLPFPWYVRGGPTIQSV